MNYSQETQKYRQHEFKKGINSEESRRKRDDTAVQIRKQKRSEILSKRRDTPLKFQKFNPAIIQGLYSDDTLCNSLKEIRKAISDNTEQTRQFVEELILTGHINKIIKCCSYVSSEIKYETAWVLTNVIAVSSPLIGPLLNNTCIIPYMIELSSSENREIRDQALWCIGNIVGESIAYREVFVHHKIITIITQSLSLELTHTDNISKIDNQLWTLINVLTSPTPPFSITQEVLPVLSKLLSEKFPNEIHEKAATCLHLISRKLYNDDIYTLATFINKNILQHLNSTSESVFIPILMTCGNILAGNSDSVQILLNAGILSYLERLLCYSDTEIRKEVCWMLSNITAGTFDEIDLFLRNNFLPAVIHHLRSDVWRVRRECIYIIANIVHSNYFVHIEKVISAGAVPLLCQQLNQVSDIEITLLILETLEKILEYFHIQKLEENHLSDIETIEELQYHDHDLIRQQAEKVCKYLSHNMDLDCN